MNTSIILAHPSPGSFNHAIAERTVDTLTKNGHQVAFHDLYSEKFDPVLQADEIPSQIEVPETIAKHCNEIAAAEGIVIVHPNWWGQPPAILKGWVDRVLRPEVAYRFLEGDSGEGVPQGLLKARTAIVFNTANTPRRRERDVFGDPLQLLWKNCIFELCGVRDVYREMFSVVVTSTAQQRRDWLDRVEAIVDRYFPKAV